MKSDSAMMLLSEYTPILAHSSKVQDTTASGRSWHKIQPREALHKFYHSHSPSCGLGSTWARASHEGGFFETHLAEQSTERKRERERERGREKRQRKRERKTIISDLLAEVKALDHAILICSEVWSNLAARWAHPS